MTSSFDKKNVFLVYIEVFGVEAQKRRIHINV